MAAPTLPAAGSFLPGSGQNASVTPLLEQWLAVSKQRPGGAVSTALTLDSNTAGRVVPTAALHRVDTQAFANSGTMGKIGVDNLDVGRRLGLAVVSAIRPVTLLHAQGTTEQMFLANGVGMVLSSDTAYVEFERRSDGWHELFRWFGAQGASARAFWGIDDSATYPFATQAEMTTATAANRHATPLGVRQALLAPGWVAALPLRPANTARFTDGLLYFDGVNFQRITLGDVLLQAPTKMFATTVALGSPWFGEYDHGLGGMPTIVRVSLLANSADNGYPAGQEIESPDLEPYASPTRIGWVSTTSPRVNTGGTTLAAMPSVTVSRWSVVLRGWR